MQKLLTFFFSKNISVYVIFYDQSLNDTLTNGNVSFEQWDLIDIRFSNLFHESDCEYLCLLWWFVNEVENPKRTK